jgi:hypothetical protein
MPKLEINNAWDIHGKACLIVHSALELCNSEWKFKS